MLGYRRLIGGVDVDGIALRLRQVEQLTGTRDVVGASGAGEEAVDPLSCKTERAIPLFALINQPLRYSSRTTQASARRPADRPTATAMADSYLEPTATRP